MKRRAISFATVLALCLSLCPMRAFADIISKITLEKNTSNTVTLEVNKPLRFDTSGYNYTISDDPAVRVTGEDTQLYLTYGRIESTVGAGIAVGAESCLYIEQTGMTVAGKTYGLDIASGAAVELSGGTFTGGTAAIHLPEGEDYGALLASAGDTRYAYFDADGKPVALADVGGETTVTVKECTDHKYSYTPDGDAPTHRGTCIYCGAEVGPLSCRFDFDDSGRGECDAGCGHTLNILISPVVEVYNGNPKPNDLSVTVMLDGDENKKLDGDSDHPDYEVEYTPITNVGETLVTVTIGTDNGAYQKIFSVTQAKPGIKWADKDGSDWDTMKTVTVDYDGRPVDGLPGVIITAETVDDVAELEQRLYYSYKKAGATDFTDGLPTDAGTYTIKASLPATQNYEAASAEITLTINKIGPIKEIPVALDLTYNGDARKLVSPGTVWDGAVILFALGGRDTAPADAAYSAAIPTAVNAGTYYVWYKVEETGNFISIDPEEPIEVTIQRKVITPIVELEYYTAVYDGGYKEPKVTVRDPDTRAVLPDSEYKVAYENYRYVGKATVTVTDVDTVTDTDADPNAETAETEQTGNYTINTAKAEFQITPADQNALTITGQRDTVTYGDVFTLGTVGGSGSGTVTWKIVGAAPEKSSDTQSVSEIAKINTKSGQVTVTGVGTVTVRATKSGADSDGEKHTTATAEWTFTAEPKRVTATVTAESKIYDGDDEATVEAAVEQGVVSGDTITISGLTGTFKDGAGAGTGKTVAVDKTGVTIKVNDETVTVEGNGNDTDIGSYIVTIPGTATADIYKAAVTVTAPELKSTAPTYSGSGQDLVNAGSVSGVSGGTAAPSMEYSLYENGPWSENIPTGTDAGDYEVWYRVPESDNYLGTAPEKVIATIQRQTVEVSNTSHNYSLTPDPNSDDGKAYYVYDGSEKKPAVTVTDGDKVIPASEYTVTYSNNVNVGTAATVIITDNPGGNYRVSGEITFEITKGGSAVLTSSPQAKDLTYNGQPQDLVTVGTASGGHLVYALEITDADGGTKVGTYSETVPQGTDAGLYKVYYKVVGDGNHTDTEPACVYVTIRPKTVTSPVIELTLPNGGYTYDGDKKEPGVASVKDSTETIDPDEYTVTYSNNINAGTATVHIVDSSGGNYDVSGSKTFTIAKADVDVTSVAAPTAIAGLTYNGAAQGLIARGYSPDGTMLYSLEKSGNYSEDIPTAVAVGTYTVYYKVRGDGNHNDYEASDPVEVTIEKANQNAFWIDGKPSGPIYYDDQFTLSAIGGSGGGAVTWTGNGATVANGLVTVTKTGTVTINATKAGGQNYEDTSATWTFTVQKKPITAIVTAENKTYDGTDKAALKVEWEPGALANGDSIATSGLSGTFDNKNVGTNKTVTIHGSITDEKYDVTIPETTKASISQATAQWDPEPNGITGLVYTGAEMALISGGRTKNGIGVVTYRLEELAEDLEEPEEEPDDLDGGYLDEDLDDLDDIIPDDDLDKGYSTKIPTATQAGTYRVWYRVEGTTNWEGIPEAYVDVTIDEAEKTEAPGSTNPGSPSASNPVKSPSVSEPSAETASIQTSERDGTASTVVNGAAVDGLVDEAMANQSEAVIIKPEITGGVTKTEVSLPASAIGRLGGETDAALTVSTPVADVTIPNEALETLSDAGGLIGVMTERVENTLVLALTADGRELGDIPGGLTLTVPMEDAGPGTVAVVIREDGTRETVRWSVAAHGAVRIPLSGSVTVELVDNSKEFSDVSSGSWAAGAVAFVSARGICDGTGGAAFSPDLAMSRAMLVTMLYNLEGRPEQEPTNGFGDVSGDAWYAAGVSWAMANGIASGYGDGQFGPNDSMTREQLAVMFWRYAGSPTVEGQAPLFLDADRASGYAVKALRWAAASGIMCGDGAGHLDPTGLATRAQAAQMLKNFMEHI